ncbi:F-box/LRR-repeat protein 14-like isoform X1 [Lolium rigidum]|nr:F-box/LRR-repeat protein 14-like isoform X1 [Lolium rigidum]
MHCSMVDLPEAMLAEIIKRVTKTSDLNSISLVSKQLYSIDAVQRGAIHIGGGLCPATEALTLEALKSICSRFPNLQKVEIDYSDWIPSHGNQLDNQGILVFSSRCPSLTDITLSFCSYINDSALGCLAYWKHLTALRLNYAPKITSSGLLSVVVGCRSLSTLHLIECDKIDNIKWLEVLGLEGSLEEFVVKNCKGISQYDLLKFGPGWMKLQKFEFEMEGEFWARGAVDYDSSYNAHNLNKYDFCCENLKDLRLARFQTWPEIGLRFVLGKCKALEKICLQYVHALNDNDMIALSQSCNNLKSISLWLRPHFYDGDYRTSFTDDSLKALACNCPMLETVELTFVCCVPEYPSETGFTHKGLLVLIQSCPVRVLMLNGAHFLDDEGMKVLWSAPLLETLELMFCELITDIGMRSVIHIPCLSNLTLRWCESVTDVGVAGLVHGRTLESLTVEGCHRVSEQAVQGAARSVHYSTAAPSHAFHKKCTIDEMASRTFS